MRYVAILLIFVWGNTFAESRDNSNLLTVMSVSMFTVGAGSLLSASIWSPVIQSQQENIDDLEAAGYNTNHESEILVDLKGRRNNLRAFGYIAMAGGVTLFIISQASRERHRPKPLSIAPVIGNDSAQLLATLRF